MLNLDHDNYHAEAYGHFLHGSGRESYTEKEVMLMEN
jgi:hypothetical protein